MWLWLQTDDAGGRACFSCASGPELLEGAGGRLAAVEAAVALLLADLPTVVGIRCGFAADRFFPTGDLRQGIWGAVGLGYRFCTGIQVPLLLQVGYL